jgi:DNA polymerase-3 subunit chi
MGEVYFYHLTRSPLERTLRVLLEKSLAQGWRVAVRGPRADLLSHLDRVLWEVPEDGFLPHGLAGGPQDAAQPVLLTTDAGPPANGATCLIGIDGAPLTAEEVQALTRSMILFDGGDPGATEAARAQWRSLTGAGVAAKYWSEESGKWEMKRASG